ncbi:MAG: recombination protein RecR [Candidatus Margulisbacteria bacterium]|nr:recombination protein RecR [Candidatus Margulisiibacteriota bacterium]
MDYNPLSPLIDHLKKLPGVGHKSATRMAFYLLSMSSKEVDEFARVLVETKQNIRYCTQCFNIGYAEKCFICDNPERDPNIICVVAEPKDLLSIEKTHDFKGVYHVLGGLISPLDGIHPEMLRLDELMHRLRVTQPKEVILAINPTIEGDATILYLAKQFESSPFQLTKLAYGLPMGADIEYVDEMTLKKALEGRVSVL